MLGGKPPHVVVKMGDYLSFCPLFRRDPVNPNTVPDERNGVRAWHGLRGSCQRFITEFSTVWDKRGHVPWACFSYTRTMTKNPKVCPPFDHFFLSCTNIGTLCMHNLPLCTAAVAAAARGLSNTKGRPRGGKVAVLCRVIVWRSGFGASVFVAEARGAVPTHAPRTAATTNWRQHNNNNNSISHLKMRRQVIEHG